MSTAELFSTGPCLLAAFGFMALLSYAFGAIPANWPCKPTYRHRDPGAFWLMLAICGATAGAGLIMILVGLVRTYFA